MPTVGVQKNSFQKEELKLRAERLVRVHQMQVRNHGRRVFQTVETEEYTPFKELKSSGYMDHNTGMGGKKWGQKFHVEPSPHKRCLDFVLGECKATEEFKLWSVYMSDMTRFWKDPSGHTVENELEWGEIRLKTESLVRRQGDPGKTKGHCSLS